MLSFTNDEIEAIVASEKACDKLAEYSDSFFHTFQPRPNDSANFDEQDGFVNSNTSGVAFCIGGNASGTSAAAVCKLVRFLLEEQPPPRRNTAFWVIGPSFEKVTKSFWNEKLVGQGFLPRSEVQWDKISWERRGAERPKEVPLKPWPRNRGGHPNKNWNLVFKSTDQDIQQFSAEAIGGFCFSEQFPWSYLEETVRGCREFNFPGSKFCEFTPLDPALSVELEEMIENDTLPQGWEVYRCNTEKNVDDPNSIVDRQWFGEFFSLISEEMADTRKIGAFASYRGRIYSTFNRNIHLASDLQKNIPLGAFHRRAIDWGAGPHNAFCVLWAYRDTLGVWHVYDEYYTTRQDYTWEDHCREIHRKDGWELEWDGGSWQLQPSGHIPRWQYGNAHFGLTYAPPDRPDLFREFTKYQLTPSAARNEVLEGVESVRVAMKIGNHGPGLLIDKDACPNLAKYIQTYRWEQPPQQTVNPTDAKPQPLKKDDHAPDALRYLLHSERTQSTGSGATGSWSEGKYRKELQFNRISRFDHVRSQLRRKRT